MEAESYHVSIGYSLGNTTDISRLVSTAEEHMYAAKRRFYQQSGIDRRARK